MDNSITISSIVDAFSTGQQTSKKWLCTEVAKLDIDLGVIFMCAGWYATMMMYAPFKFSKCISIDSDPTCRLVAESLNRDLVMDEWKFKAVTEDILRVNYDRHEFTLTRSNGTTCEVSYSPDTIINTSCEHISDFDSWYGSIPAGKIVILQSNNGFGIDGHVNCVDNLQCFIDQVPLTKILYTGEIALPKFSRYMIIGIK